jgi:hypothetical protein
MRVRKSLKTGREIDRLQAENKELKAQLTKAYGRITALSLKEGRAKIADIFQQLQAENEKLGKEIDRL